MLQIQEPKHNGTYWITNSMNQIVGFQTHQIGIVQALNGKNTIEQLKKITLDDLKNNKISANEGKEKITDEKKLKVVADALVDQTLEILRTSYSFVA